MIEENDDSKKRNEKRPSLILWETFDAERHHEWGWENLHGEILREFDESGRQVSIGAKVYIKYEESYIWSRDLRSRSSRKISGASGLRGDCGILDKIPVYSHVDGIRVLAQLI